jgi:hypothetical protein
MVRNTIKKCLHFTSIEVIGYNMDLNGGNGINVVALHPKDHSILLAKSYNTAANDGASGDLISDMNAIRRGSIVIAAVRNSGAEKLSGEAKDVFKKLGSHEVDGLQANEGWAFIGIKG